MATRIITPEATLSYPHLHEPQQPRNGKGDPKYSAALIFPAGTDLKELEAAILEAATAKWGDKARDMIRKGQLKLPLRKGEEKDYPEGSIFTNVRAGSQPGMVYAYPDPETGKPMKVAQTDIRTVFYPGAIVKADLTAFSYDNESKGVSFGLNNIQKIRDGERIDGRTPAEDVFTADLSQAPADLRELLGMND